MGETMRTFFILVSFMLINPVWADCKVSDITIKSMKTKFVDECTRSPCIYMKGVAALTNNCVEAGGKGTEKPLTYPVCLALAWSKQAC